MPVRLLSLPVEDLQYALECMNVGDLIAFSLCSKRTKHLAKSLNRKIDTPSVYVSENCIGIDILPDDCQELPDDEDLEDPDFQDFQDNENVSLELFDSSINIDRGNGVEEWRKPEFTQGDWIAHLLSIFNETMIYALEIDDISLPYLDTVKEFIPKCQKLRINSFCSDDVAKIAFHKLFPLIEEVEIEKNIFANEIDISQFLTPNLRSLSFIDFDNPFKLTADDLLAVKITKLSVEPANITEKELNRFVKLWMKGNNTFYSPKSIKLTLDYEFRRNRRKVFKGIQYEFVEEDDDFQFRMRRGDGKELMVHIEDNLIIFNFP
ncbi:hypothetical protein B9Z55_021615 [Caenorhabditis nigoni]|uniref:F-box domain-containing protein n=1 Tax=Caenorhabditis nigoni TaxID=1611254 RepID=A0A2G5TSR8_9PELO|nr:hypothetical protein B9Z55_021615 [Caenorhabditis nigoni]